MLDVITRDHILLDVVTGDQILLDVITADYTYLRTSHMSLTLTLAALRLREYPIRLTGGLIMMI